MFVSSCSVVVHIDETVLHAGNISQILWQVLGIKGVFPILWRRCEGLWMEVTYKLIIWALKTFCKKHYLVTLLRGVFFSPHLAAPDLQV